MIAIKLMLFHFTYLQAVLFAVRQLEEVPLYFTIWDAATRQQVRLSSPFIAGVYDRREMVGIMNFALYLTIYPPPPPKIGP